MLVVAFFPAWAAPASAAVEVAAAAEAIWIESEERKAMGARRQMAVELEEMV
jgi:hypothetical protein